MSKTRRSTILLALAAVGVIAVGVLSTRRPPPEKTGQHPPAPPTQAPVFRPPPPPGTPGPEMTPGEVRPGPKPGTLVVQPFQPGPPKTISVNYRVPTHREDARITKRPDGATVFEEAIYLARQLHTSQTPPGEDLQILDTILGYYRLVYRTNPVAGENLEVMAALTGKNEHTIVVFPPDHPDLNSSGELLDRWGQPYYFHALSSTKLDIWSPGPDRKRNTSDDLKLGLEQTER